MLQFPIQSCTCRSWGTCAVLMGLFVYKELPTHLWFGRIRLLLCICKIECGRRMNEGLLDQKTAGVEVSAKLCNGPVTAMWQLATTPPKNALRYWTWRSRRNIYFSSWAVRTESFNCLTSVGRKYYSCDLFKAKLSFLFFLLYFAQTFCAFERNSCGRCFQTSYHIAAAPGSCF